MSRKRHTEEQIIGIIKKHDAGMSTADLCREHGISTATFYKWKAKFGGMDLSDAKRLKVLEDENRKLNNQGVKSLLDYMHPLTAHTVFSRRFLYEVWP